MHHLGRIERDPEEVHHWGRLQKDPWGKKKKEVHHLGRIEKDPEGKMERMLHYLGKVQKEVNPVMVDWVLMEVDEDCFRLPFLQPSI